MAVLKVYNGSSWVQAKFKVYNGTGWEETAKIWDGTQWVEFSPGLTFSLSGTDDLAFTPLDTPATIQAGVTLASSGQEVRYSTSTNLSGWCRPLSTVDASGYRAKFTDGTPTGSGFTRSYTSGQTYNLATGKAFYIQKNVANAADNCSQPGTLVIETDPGGVEVASAAYTFTLNYLE